MLIDDLSRYMCVVVLDSNGEAANVIRRAQAAAEVECGRKLRTDNGGEFTTAEFISYCADEGVQCHYSAPYSSGPPQAEVNACCLLGRGSGDGCLHPQPLGKELGHIGKLDNRSTLGVFIGYAEGSKAYRILDPGTQRVRMTRDIVFDEGRGWAWDKAVDDGSTPTYDNFTIEYVHFEGAGGIGSSLPLSMSTPVPVPPPTSAPRSLATTSVAMRSSPPPPQPVTPCTPASTATPPGTSTLTPARVEHNPVEFATPLSHNEECINAYHDG
jgi:hypothetical protein